MLLVGDCVANADPKAVSYEWHGTIVKMYSDNNEVCWVDWEERKVKDDKNRFKFKQSVITARLENLRKIDPFTKTNPI